MSNIYIQEPPTSGKVLLKTSVGDIDIELWCREAPKACRNFIQLCMEGYYNGTIFHRLVKGFIVQGGDPNGDGTGGESVYGGTFKDEFHSRLRFIRRGLVAMANAGRDDNASQFFFTLGEATELQNKHTLFGKVTGDTVYNMLKLEESEVDQNERPMYAQRILKTEVLLNPFEDIVPRQVVRSQAKEKKKKEKGVKNFGLLSFGNEAEEDEEETNEFVQKNSGKAKSTHDLLVDPKLSKETATFVKFEKDSDEEKPTSNQSDNDDDEADESARTEAIKAAVRNKLTKNSRGSSTLPSAAKPSKQTPKAPAEVVDVSDSGSDSDGLNNELERERRNKKKIKANEIREQISSLKRDYQKDKRDKDAELAAKQAKVVAAPVVSGDNGVLEDYLSEQKKYSHLKSDVPKKGAQREQQTLELLKRFKSKLQQVKQSGDTDDDDDEEHDHKKAAPSVVAVREITSDNEDDIAGDSWLGHTLRFEEKAPVLAKDASTKHDGWYDAFDPRNPLNKRKRGDEKESSGSGRDRRGGDKRSSAGRR